MDAQYRGLAGLEAVIGAQGTGFDLLLGRTTYDIWAGYWPNAGDTPIANSLNSATKYIATHRPESLEWGPVKNLGDDVISGIRDLKSTDGPDLIVWGSSTLTSVMLEQGLADELVLIVTRCCWATVNAYWRIVMPRVNLRSSARRPSQQMCS